jgi:hypothetical protein
MKMNIDTNSDIFKGVGIEVTLPDDDSFLKVKETLTRIGISSRKEKVLWQSANILHRRGRYVILSFKELFILDNKPSSLNENDIQRRNTICKLLEDWGLVKIVASEREQVINNLAPLNQIKIIPYKEKSEWRLENKHTIGKSRNV